MAGGVFNISEQVYKTIYELGTNLRIKPISEFTNPLHFSDADYYDYASYSIELTDPSLSTTTFDKPGANIELIKSGIYTLKYSGKNYHYVYPTFYFSDFTYSYTFSVVENKLPLKKWTITDVINRTLDLAEPLRKGEKARFRLNGMSADGKIVGGQAEQFDKILAPQFSFTKSLLRECLQEIGKVIHGEPRIIPKKDENGWYYELSYDMYAGQERSRIGTKPYQRKDVSQNLEQYASHLDSNAENLVNQLDKYSGVIIEPYDGGVKTVRTDNVYVRITDGNMIIPTQYPIYTVDKLEYVYESGGELKSADITPWLFESTIYSSRLSSYKDGQYSYSKAYALHYTQGQKNIGGLNFNVDSAAFQAYQDYAIVNILKQAINGYSPPKDYPNYAFRITYTPFYNVRVAQTKPYYKDFIRPAALIYNQQSNVIESRYYGENLKGAIARLGNVELAYTYILGRLQDIPKIGQMYDDNYYISAVAVEILPTLIRCTVALSKDFNRLSAYIGVSSVKRFSEVSQTQAAERNILYREFIVVGKQETPDDDSLIGQGLLSAIAATFNQEGGYKPLTNVIAWGSSYAYDETHRLNAVNLPVISSAFGNSISFSWAYKDNYSAGEVSQFQENAIKDNGKTVSGYFQNDYCYTDYYGKIYYYDFDLQQCGAQINAGNYRDIGRDLPAGDIVEQSSGYFSTIGKTPYVLRKDNREILQVNVQIDFVTNLENFIIGSALAAYCPAVRGTSDTYVGELINTEIFSDGSTYVGSTGTPTLYESGKAYRVLVGDGVYAPAHVETRTDESASAGDDYYLAIDKDSEYKDFQGSASVYEGTPTARLYVFNTELNKFTDHVEAYEDIKLSEMKSVDVYTNSYNGYFMVYAKGNTFPAAGKSWAIVTRQHTKSAERVEDEFGKEYTQEEVIGGDLLIGQNLEVTAGQQFTPIYFTKKRKIFDETVWKYPR